MVGTANARSPTRYGREVNDPRPFWVAILPLAPISELPSHQIVLPDR